MPTAVAPLSVSLIDDSIVKSLERVFQTMMRKEIKLVEKTETLDVPIEGPKAQIMGSVGFVGEINGLIYLRFSEDFAALATGWILGMTPAEVEENGPEVIKDAIGELTNMSVGGFKNAFCDVGFPCKLTLPTIVRGEKLIVTSIKGATRHIFHFDCNGHRVLADLQMKTE